MAAVAGGAGGPALLVASLARTNAGTVSNWGWEALVAALVIGMAGYGLSITLWVEGARDLGAARGQMIFAAAPFIGAALSWLALAEAIRVTQLVAVVLAAAGVTVSLRTATNTHIGTNPSRMTTSTPTTTVTTTTSTPTDSAAGTHTRTITPRSSTPIRTCPTSTTATTTTEEVARGTARDFEDSATIVALRCGQRCGRRHALPNDNRNLARQFVDLLGIKSCGPMNPIWTFFVVPFVSS